MFMAQASAYEQLMLELVNKERAKKGAQPLAFNSNLNTSADKHSSWMIAADTFSHTGSAGSTPTARMTSAGYSFTDSWGSAENIAWASTRAPSGYQDEVQLLHRNLMNSAGHKANILNGSYREIGIGFATGEYQGWNGAFVTENFALSGNKVFLTGVALADKDGDRFYDVGEGLKGIQVTAVGSNGATYSTTTQNAGGYSLALAAGTYTVTFSGSGVPTTTKQVTIGSQNVKLDVVSGSATASAKSDQKPASDFSGNDKISGTEAAETITGFGGNDVIYGKDGDDRLYGGVGNDKLYGQSGNDWLHGGAGNDMLEGGAGNDTLTGGSGADSFRFRENWGADTITDFKRGVDLIDLRTTGLKFKDLAIAAYDADGDGRIDDTVITTDHGSIALLNLKAALIGSPDFLF
jgi:Ca2+-binding RTX toxin-like protein